MVERRHLTHRRFVTGSGAAVGIAAAGRFVLRAVPGAPGTTPRADMAALRHDVLGAPLRVALHRTQIFTRVFQEIADNLSCRKRSMGRRCLDRFSWNPVMIVPRKTAGGSWPARARAALADRPPATRAARSVRGAIESYAVASARRARILGPPDRRTLRCGSCQKSIWPASSANGIGRRTSDGRPKGTVEPFGPNRRGVRRLTARLTGAVAVALVCAAACLAASPVWACYAVIVGRGASADGSVLVGHNEQNGGRRVLHFTVVPRREFPPGSLVPLCRGGTLPQVPQTWSFLWSENPGLEFSDAYLNEWGVAVVSDGCPTREDDYQALVARGEIRDGGIGYMLRRLVAERARSARDGVRVASELIEQFGYVDSGRTYVIADPEEAWLLAVVRGRRWVARRVPDDVVVLLPNVHIIEEVDLSDRANYLASDDLVSYAVARGWFDPEAGRPFNFRLVYGLAEHAQPDPRRLRGQQLVAGGAALPASSFGVKPAQKMTVAAVAAILRDRAGSRPISSQVTQEGAVFQLRSGLPREIGCVYWRATAQPAISVFTPWYLGITQTPPSYDRPVDIRTRMTLEHHFAPPAGTFDADSPLAWWTFKQLQDLAHRAGEQQIEWVRQAWQAHETALFEEQAARERELLELWKTDPQEARRRLTEYCSAAAERARSRAEELIAILKRGS